MLRSCFKDGSYGSPENDILRMCSPRVLTTCISVRAVAAYSSPHRPSEGQRRRVETHTGRYTGGTTKRYVTAYHDEYKRYVRAYHVYLHINTESSKEKEKEKKSSMKISTPCPPPPTSKLFPHSTTTTHIQACGSKWPCRSSPPCIDPPLLTSSCGTSPRRRHRDRLVPSSCRP